MSEIKYIKGYPDYMRDLINIVNSVMFLRLWSTAGLNSHGVLGECESPGAIMPGLFLNVAAGRTI